MLSLLEETYRAQINAALALLNSINEDKTADHSTLNTELLNNPAKP
jgi:hypothetical protein